MHHVRIQRAVLALGLTCAAFVGCQGSEPDAEATGSVRLAVLGGPSHDVTQFEIAIVEAGGDCNAGPVVASQLVTLETETLPPSLGGGADHRFADGLFVLPPATYLACAKPLQASAAASTECAPASATVSVSGGVTNEVVLVSQCAGEENGGLDVAAALNDAPVVDDLHVSPSKFINLCESAAIQVAASDPDGDPLSYSWLVSGSPSGSTPLLTTAADSATFSTDTTGSYEITVTISDAHAAQTSLSFPIHVQDNPCSGEALWLTSAGGSGLDAAESLAVDAAGNVYALGDFESTSIDFGLGAHNRVGSGADVFLVALDPGGAPVWSRSFGDNQDDQGGVVALDPGGNLVLTGNFRGTIDLGCGTMTSGGHYDVFVAKLASTDGSCLWSKVVGGPGPDIAESIVVSSSGEIALAGRFQGTLDVSPLPALSAVVGASNPFYLKLDAGGVPIWAHAAVGTGLADIFGLAIDPAGDVVVAGFYDTGSLTFDDGGAGTSTPPNAGQSDAFVAKVAGSDGLLQWLQTSSTSGDVSPGRIAIDQLGDVIVTGAFNGTLGLGSTATAPSGGDISSFSHAFVAKLSGATGAHVWTTTSNNASGMGYVFAVAIDPLNRVLATGVVQDSFDFGGDTHSDAFVASFDNTDGSELWVTSASGSSLSSLGTGFDLAVDGAGFIYATGYFGADSGDTFSIGGAPVVTSAGGNDSWIAKLSP
jgi:hypothetical protein